MLLWRQWMSREAEHWLQCYHNASQATKTPQDLGSNRETGLDSVPTADSIRCRVLVLLKGVVGQRS